MGSKVLNFHGIAELSELSGRRNLSLKLISVTCEFFLTILPKIKRTFLQTPFCEAENVQKSSTTKKTFLNTATS